MKVTVCCIAKMENRYIREWVDWYKKLNFDRIIIVDNNDIDGETFVESIPDYIEDGTVEIIDRRGEEKAQFASYNYVYQKVFNEDWIAFFDVDEFLVLEKHDTIQEYLSMFDGNTDVVKINWMCYGDCGNVYYEDKLVNERFKDPLPYDYSTGRIPNNYHTKCIIRSNCSEKNISYCVNPHVPLGNNIVYRNSAGKLTGSSPFEKYDFNYSYLKHFTTKTIQEFIENKMVRGVPDRSREDAKRDVNLDMFFGYNEKTYEKLKVVEQYK